MRKTLAALAFTVALALASHAEALPATCLPSPLPATPVAPIFSLSLNFFSDRALATIWRQPCTDGSGQVAVLIRLTAVTSAPFVCSGDFVIVQNGIQRDGRIATSTSGSPSFCGDLFVPTTVVLLAGGSQPDYDEMAAFTLIYDASQATSVEIPASGPPPAGPPSVVVVATGCTPCHAGQGLGFELHVTNPGVPRLVELKTGARLPTGEIVSILGRHEEETLPTGTTVIPMFSGLVLPPGTPAGAYTIEAALLEPELGATISRHAVGLTLQP